MPDSAQRLTQRLCHDMTLPLVSSEQEPVFFALLVERVVNCVPRELALAFANPARRQPESLLQPHVNLARDRIRAALFTYAIWLPEAAANEIIASCLDHLIRIAAGEVDPEEPEVAPEVSDTTPLADAPLAEPEVAPEVSDTTPLADAPLAEPEVAPEVSQ